MRHRIRRDRHRFGTIECLTVNLEKRSGDDARNHPATAEAVRQVTACTDMTTHNQWHAVAARSASMTGTGRMAFILPNCSATAVSIGIMRLLKRVVSSASQVSSASTIRESRRRASFAPMRISPSTSGLSQRSSSAMLFHYAATAGSARKPLRTSEIMFVSIRKVTGQRHAQNRADVRDRFPQATPRPATP